MKIYVAGASVEWRENRAAMQRCRELGYDVTLDWTESVEKFGAERDHELSENDRFDFAAKDLDAIAAADVVWMRVPVAPHRGCGCWVELGAALAHDKAVVISGDASRTIFSSLAMVSAMNDERALQWLSDRAERLRRGRCQQ